MTTLRDAVGEYLEMRRSLGFKLQETGKLLIDFVTIHGRAALLLHHGPVGARLGAAIIDRAARRMGAPPECRAHFARHRSATDLRTQIPPPGLLPFQPKRARPYLYSDEEIRSLLRAALRMPYRYKRWISCDPGSIIVCSAC